MRDVIALRATHTVAPGDHIYNSIVSFEMSPGPLPVGTMRVSGGGWFIASASFFSLSSPLRITGWLFLLLIFQL